MVYGAILDTGQKYFTDMHAIMHGLGDVGPRHNWLITDWTCYSYPPEMREDNEWKTGAELMQMLDSILGVQWVWSLALSRTSPRNRSCSTLRHMLMEMQDFGQTRLQYNTLLPA